MAINWKTARWICILIAALSATFLLGIAQSVLGIGLAEEFIGFKVQTLLGIANIAVVWLLYKVL